MELREYLHIMAKRAWLILPLTVLALVASLWFSYQQTPIYRATSTFVAKLDPSLLNAPSDTLIYGIDTLAGRQRIFVTYCEVMTSRSVRQEAYALMSVDPQAAKLDDYKVTCSNLVETNVLSISVEGPSRAVAQQLNEAIGIAGSIRANALYNSFPLENLDPARVEDDPVSPNTTRNGVLGGLLGLAIGITLALLIEYLRTPFERLEAAAIRDLALGTYNERYFRQRFTQELNRPYAKMRPVSVALLQLTPNEEFGLLPANAQTALLRSAALTIQDTLRQRTDIIAYLRPWTFGVLLTETPGEEARMILQRLHNEIRSRPHEASGYVATFVANTGIVSGNGDSMEYLPALQEAAQALATAQSQGENAIHLVTTTPAPFVLGQSEQRPSRRGRREQPVFNVSEEDLFGSAADDSFDWGRALAEAAEADSAAAPTASTEREPQNLLRRRSRSARSRSGSEPSAPADSASEDR